MSPLYHLSYDELCRNLAVPGPLAWESCFALGRLGSTQSLEKLVELTKNGDWRYRRCAIEAIGYHPGSDTAVENLRKALYDPSPYVVRTARGFTT